MRVQEKEVTEILEMSDNQEIAEKSKSSVPNTAESTEILDTVAEFQESQILLSKIVLDAIQKDIEKDDLPRRVEIPEFTSPIVFETARWEISRPITLHAERWINGSIEGIHVEPGFYIVKYSGSVLSTEATGIGFFENKYASPTHILSWHTRARTDNEDVTEIKGSRHLYLDKSGVIGVFNFEGELGPKFWGAYVITLMKLKITPH